MPYEIGFLEDKGVVTIINTAEIYGEDVVNMTHESFELSQSKQVGSFLVDCTNMISRLGALDIYQLPAIYEQITSPRTNRVAVLKSNNKDTNRTLEFYKTVCGNRGWLIDIFSDKDAALKWLKGETG